MNVYDAVTRIEGRHELDDLVAFIDRATPDLLREGRLHNLLAGTGIGHALHPLLTDVPVGTWTSATLLDLLGRRWQRASLILTTIGLAAAVPTAASGIVDWRGTDRRQRRVGAVHAVANTSAAACYVVSAVAKLARRPRLGTAAATIGLSALAVGGYLGGHLSYARGVGVDRTISHRQREEWFEVEAVVGGDRGTVIARETPGDRFIVCGPADGRIAVTGHCTRCATPLEILAPGLLECPHDGSRFHALDATIERGPATTPLPTFEVSDGDNRLRLRHTG